MRGFEENTSQGIDGSQGGFCFPFLTQNEFDLTHSGPSKLQSARHCGKNDRLDPF